MVPIAREQPLVALCTRTPHSRAFGEVKHTELNHGLVCDDARIAAESIYLTDNLPFGNTTHGRVAGHLANGIDIHGNEERCGTHIGGGGSSLGTGMSGTNNNDIIRGRKHGEKGDN